MLVVTGPPGSGKSTVSKLLAQRSGPSALVEGDRFFGFLARGAIEPWLPESDEQNRVVMAAAASAAGRFAQSGFATVFDGIVGPWFLDLFLSSTGLTELDYVVLLPSVETCIESRVRWDSSRLSRELWVSSGRVTETSAARLPAPASSG